MIMRITLITRSHWEKWALHINCREYRKKINLAYNLEIKGSYLKNQVEGNKRCSCFTIGNIQFNRGLESSGYGGNEPYCCPLWIKYYIP